jgi:hypothetical protein
MEGNRVLCQEEITGQQQSHSGNEFIRGKIAVPTDRADSEQRQLHNTAEYLNPCFPCLLPFGSPST